MWVNFIQLTWNKSWFSGLHNHNKKQRCSKTRIFLILWGEKRGTDSVKCPISWIRLSENTSPFPWILQELLLFRPSNVNWIDFEVHKGFPRVKVEERLKGFFSTEWFDPISLTEHIRLICGDTFKNSRNQQNGQLITFPNDS